MKVSIIIPVYNVGAYIERCLYSVFNQTYKDIEVILVDDCGNDNSVAIVQDLIKNNTKLDFKLINHKQNRGLSAARNTGIEHATGEYLFFLDSDDELTSNCIEQLAKFAVEYKPDFLIGDYSVKGSSKSFPPLALSQNYIESNKLILKYYVSRLWYMMAWNKLIAYEFIKRHKLYFKEGIIHEDDLWSFMVACKADSLFVLKEPTYIYTIRQGSIMGNLNLNHHKSRSEIIRSMVDFVKNDPELISKPLIYSYIEELKSQYFTNILKTETSSKFKYDFYKSLRESTYIRNPFPIRTYALTLSQLTRNIHYLLPTVWGYRYYQVSLKLKRTLGF